MESLLDRFKLLEKKHVEPSFKTVVWRLFAYFGHTFFRRKPPLIESSSLKLLNLGAGDTKFEGFVHADFYRLHRILSKAKVDWMLDLTKPIKCDDNYWDGILIEHVNEHLLYSQNYFLFKELSRILRSGGVLRIVIPDLDHYLSWDKILLAEPKMNRYKSLPEALSNLAQNHAHISIWNKELLQEVLEDIGFVDIVETSYGVGSLKELVQDSEKHKWQSLYLEAKKP